MSVGSVWDTIVIGAGAAGLVAAERSAASGNRTLLLEKNSKAGVKILMSGGTRCNLTHATDARGIVEAFGQSGRFLHSALSYLDPDAVVQMFEQCGVATKVESTGKVFPESDRALHVRDALVSRLEDSGAVMRLGAPVRSLQREGDEGFRIATDRDELSARRVIVTVGGQSYPGCGTTGDGYQWLKGLGHTIISPVPALVPLTTESRWLQDLSGVSFENVGVSLQPRTKWRDFKPRLRRELQCRSDLLLTHFGLSGPAAMNVSRGVTRYAEQDWEVVIDLFPDIGAEQLLQQLREMCVENARRELGTIFSRWVVQRFAQAGLRHLRFDEHRRAGEIPLAWHQRLVELTKSLRVPVTGTQGFPKAEVTAGGVDLREVDSRTLASKRVPGLYLAGEILDLDGPIGGYNFQAAFSTGWLAGYQGNTPVAWRDQGRI